MADGQLITDAHRIAHLPIVIVQGRYDVVCPMTTSWELYEALGGAQNPNVEYNVIANSGHSAQEPGIKEALLNAVEKFKTLKA
jgi:proline iminopeptidase